MSTKVFKVYGTIDKSFITKIELVSDPYKEELTRILISFEDDTVIEFQALGMGSNNPDSQIFKIDKKKWR